MACPVDMPIEEYVSRIERENEAMCATIHKMNNECQAIILKKENEFMDRCAACGLK